MAGGTTRIEAGGIAFAIVAAGLLSTCERSSNVARLTDTTFVRSVGMGAEVCDAATMTCKAFK